MPHDADQSKSTGRLIAALETIKGLGGLTLICGSFAPGDDASRAYSLGAHRAFEQAANIARAALAGEDAPV